jgi:hypothetical protein
VVRRVVLDERWYIMAPWAIACPVTESRFVPQLPEHAVYNIQTDMAAIGSFGGMVERPDFDALLFSDLQTQTGFHEYGRLGSGRTGFYRGAYLKGIGRTPLAANWWRFKDRFHATGHLGASGAARELIVSRYFLAKGKGHLINPCRGLLIAELEPQLREARAWRRWTDEECLPCDLALQAISVKDDRFLRFSNVVWHLNNINVAHAESDLIRFFGYLMNGLCPDEPIDVGQLVPSRIAATLAATIERTIQNFREYFRLGINWLMPYNNFTIDGRFCDLDVPLFTGPGYLGAALNCELWQAGSATAYAPDHVDFGSIFGLSAIAYLHQVRTVLCSIEAGFRGLLRANFHYSEPEREFMNGFLYSLEEALPPSHVLWSGAACARMLKGWIDEDCEIEAAHRAEIDELVDHAVVTRLDHAVLAGRTISVEKVEGLRCARAGASPNLTESFYAITGSRVRPEKLEEAQFLNDCVARLDALTDRDEFLAAITEVAASIDHHCGTRARAGT